MLHFDATNFANTELSTHSAANVVINLSKTHIMAAPRTAAIGVFPQSHITQLVDSIKALKGDDSVSFSTHEAEFSDLILPKLEKNGLTVPLQNSYSSFCKLKHGFAAGFSNGEVMVVLPPCADVVLVESGNEIVAMAPFTQQLLAFTANGSYFLETDVLTPTPGPSFPGSSLTCVTSIQSSNDLLIGLTNGDIQICLDFHPTWELSEFTSQTYTLNEPEYKVVAITAIETESWFFAQYIGEDHIYVIWKRENATKLHQFRMKYNANFPMTIVPGQESQFPRWPSKLIVEANRIVYMNTEDNTTWKDRKYVDLKLNKGIVWEMTRTISKLDYLQYRAQAKNCATFRIPDFCVFLEKEIEQMTETDWLKAEVDKDQALNVAVMKVQTRCPYSDWVVSEDGLYVCLLGDRELKVLSVGAIECILTHTFDANFADIGESQIIHKRFGGLFFNQNSVFMNRSELEKLQYQFSPDTNFFASWTGNSENWTLKKTETKEVLLSAEPGVKKIVFSKFDGVVVLVYKDKVKVCDIISSASRELCTSSDFTNYFWKQENHIFAFQPGVSGAVFFMPPTGFCKETPLALDIKFEVVTDVSNDSYDFLLSYTNKTVYYSWDKPENCYSIDQNYYDLKAFANGKLCAGLFEHLTMILELPALRPMMKFTWDQRLCLDWISPTFLSYCTDPKNPSFGIVKVWDTMVGIPTRSIDFGLKKFADSLGMNSFGWRNKNSNELPVDFHNPFHPVIQHLWKFEIPKYTVKETPKEIPIQEIHKDTGLQFLGAETLASYCSGVKRLAWLLSKQKDVQIELDEAVCRLVVYPYTANVLHFLVALRDYRHIPSAFALSAKLIKGTFGTPISLCFTESDKGKSSNKCLDCLLEGLIALQASNPDEFLIALHQLDSDFVNLLESESVYLITFLEMIIVPLPHELISEIASTWVRKIPVPRLQKDLRQSSMPWCLQVPYFTKQLIRPEFLICPIGMNVNVATPEGNRLMQTLKTSDPSFSILSQKVIKLLAELKWHRVMYVWIILSVLYWVLLAMIICRIYNYGDQDAVSIIIIVINSMLLILEIIQILYSRLDYIKGFWNWIDIARIAFTYPYAIVSERIWLTFVTVVLSSIRGLTTFESLDQTRFLVKMILKVCRETFFFVLIFIYSNVCFGVMLKVSQDDPDNKNFFESWKRSFELSMGNYDSSRSLALQWTVFFFASLVDVIWILNLLISILGTAYDSFRSQIMAEDVQTQIELVYEMEQLNLFKSSSDTSLHYLVVFDEKPKEDNPRSEQVTLFALRQELDSRNASVNTRIDLIESKLDQILQSIKETASKNRFPQSLPAK